MADLRSLMAYVCQNYAYPQELTKARLTKIIYLIDWKMALEHRRQASPVNWLYNHYGPYVTDVVSTARSAPEFEVEVGENMYGNRRELIKLNARIEPGLTAQEREAADFILQKVAPMTWDSFIRLVYSTYPIIVTDRGEEMDLVALAEAYQATQVGELPNVA